MMMKLELYQYVALCRDFPKYNLKQGDVAMLIDYVTHPIGGEDGYVLEDVLKVLLSVAKRSRSP
jgi:hypothetical protein